MKCSKCYAYGQDSLNFYWCLIRQTMLDLKSGQGCRLRKKTIDERIKETKETDPRNSQYIYGELIPN